MIRIFTLVLFLTGCNDIIHMEHIETVDSYTISEVGSPPWVKLILRDLSTGDNVTVHLQRHCYKHKEIPIGLKFQVHKTEITYEDYSTEIKTYPDYEQTQNIIYKYCN